MKIEQEEKEEEENMEEGTEAEACVGYVDWKGKPAVRGKHGGMLAASFVLAVEIMENMAYLANASNLVTYLAGFMHFSLSRSATTVTNFMATAFLLALLGGFLSDAFFTAYHIYLISALLEFLGLVILAVQAKTASLKPPPGEEAAGGKTVILFAGLYLTALGVGGIKGSLAPHGGEQFDESTARGHKARSTFFNYFIFCLASGGLLAVTFVVWVEDNKGWQWGFGISTITILLSIPVFLAGSPLYRNKVPTGSPVTTIAKVLLAAISSRRGNFQSARNAVVDLEQSSPAKESKESEVRGPGEELKWLNRAAEGRPLHRALLCAAHEVEDVKVVLKLLPIFLSTIMLSCCLAQLSTFSVQQAATMDTRVGGLKVPPASLPVFPVIFIMALVPLYDHAIVPLARRATGSDTGITHLQRIGMGLALSVVAMAVAAAVEMKRKRVALRVGEGFKGPLPITFFWVAFQYLFLGSADLFTLAGLLEFFFSEAPARMRSLATSLSWASLAMGYYLSSALVSMVNRVTTTSSGGVGRKGWLSGGSLNRYHLDRFYWLMCVLSALNLANFVFWATRYRYRSGQKQ
ncbi:protein NRT1/ PTR FAMILY 4.6-like isoform X1 [Zingiber officinale]|uniref:protein NRT1/ PTR FAMILY 4.6-like isoform X1 n=1 Tax=Zingiber officinale TaxID=94328 RepID=UPI001C4D6F19|nr:protein NRT1/ PTR FAMILY 4.6-like isoform X1 [Zingiber officinale]